MNDFDYIEFEWEASATPGIATVTLMHDLDGWDGAEWSDHDQERWEAARTILAFRCRAGFRHAWAVLRALQYKDQVTIHGRNPRFWPLQIGTGKTLVFKATS